MTARSRPRKRTKGAPVSTLEIALRDLPIIKDDLFLGMQAANLHVVDQMLRDMERELRAQYIQEEVTPVEFARVVSALSQLWIFGLYELLRSWRCRAERIIKFSESLDGKPDEERKKLIEAKRCKVVAAAQASKDLKSRWRLFEKAISDMAFVRRLQSAADGSEMLFRRLHALRITLAKHEIPEQGGYALAPGYGRIDEVNGSICWQVLLGDREVDMISRRDLADEACRLAEDRTAFILPRFIQTRISTFPKFGYYLRRIKVTLKSGEQISNVLVFSNKILVGPRRSPKARFAASDVVEVEPDTQP